MLKGVIGVPATRNIQTQVRECGVPGVWEHSPRCWNQTLPLLPDRQHEQIGQAGQQPAEDSCEVPETAQPEIVPARQREP